MKSKKTKLLFLALSAVTATAAQTDSSNCEWGIASYYAQAFEGRRCSNGEIFRHDSLTAAHKSLKFGTRLKITNLKNDSVIVVRVNDRLPKNSKRCIDLTKSGAKKLNFVKQGLTKVKMEIVVDTISPKIIRPDSLNQN